MGLELQRAVSEVRAMASGRSELLIRLSGSRLELSDDKSALQYPRLGVRTSLKISTVQASLCDVGDPYQTSTAAL